MSIHRRLLFSAYKLVKKTGYLSERSASSPCASILMFHRVNDYGPDSLSMRVDVFDEMLRVLKDEYRVVPLSSLTDSIEGKRKIEAGSVVITFDDGYRDNFLYAAPLLRKYQLPATFFVTSGYIGTDRVFPWDARSAVKFQLMNWEEVRELNRSGFEIGGHTANHVNLGVVPVDEAMKEIVGCKEKIEEQLGKRIAAFAYPFGRSDCIRDEILPIIREAGFRCCCSGYGGKVTGENELFNLYRIPVYPTTIELLMEIDNFMTYFDGKMRINITGRIEGNAMDERSVPNHEEVIRIDTYIAATDDPIEDNDHYKGLRIHSVKGLHEFVAGKILETFPPGSTVLDLGSGTGAMSLRLSDIGFRVTAADIVPENFKLHGKIPFRNVNLNDTFSHSFDSRFKGIVAIEIIEHLENPRRFLRECYKLLSPGGVFVMSTPNIDNPISKASFVRDGTFQWYLDFDYEHQGHIMPISQWLLRKCITESGFDLLWMGSFGDPFANMEGWWKIRFFALLLRFVSKTDRSLNGEIMVVVLRKPAGAK